MTPSKRPTIPTTLTLIAMLFIGSACSSSLDIENEQDDTTSDTQQVSTSCSTAPKIITRAQWGARTARARRATHSPNRITIHHTEQGTNHSGASAIRGVQNWHMDGNGWADIGYHFLVDRDGTIYQGNPENLVGAHVASQNRGNLGIAMIGSFEKETLGAVQKQAVARLVRHLARKYNIAINRTNIKGHGERMATSCPGKVNLNELVELARTCKATQNPTSPQTPTTSYDPIEVYWARLSDGTYKLHALAGSQTTRVAYYVDGFPIGAADRSKGSNFPDTYKFSSETNERLFEVRGFDANGKQISRGIGLIDVTQGAGLYIRQMGKNLFEVGVERAPDGVAHVELLVDDQWEITDSVSGDKQSTRGAVRHAFSSLGKRTFKLSTFNADGSLRGAFHRTFDLSGGQSSTDTPDQPDASAIDVKYYYQYNNSYAPSATCGSTSAAMLLSQYGRTMTPDQLYQKYKNRDTGSNYKIWQSPWGLEKIYKEELGYGAHTYKGNFRLIKHNIDQGRPVVIHGDFTRAGHIMLVVGYDSKGLIVNDPSGKWAGCRRCGYPGRTPTNGKNIHYSYSALEAVMDYSYQNGFWVSTGATKPFEFWP